MALSPRELEDDIIIATQEVRRNPEVLLHELRILKDERHAYYTPSTHMANLIGETDLKEAIDDAIFKLQGMVSTNAMIHTRELELAARDFIDSKNPGYDLSTRVSKYTNWEGEINEIVHYSKTNVRGIDVLANMIISDYCGDTFNMRTILDPNYKFFGVRCFNHDLYDYCCVMVFAEEIYSSFKSAIHTSENIDCELMEEREILGRKVAANCDYEYSSKFARDNPNVRLSTYMNESRKSKRLVRFNQNDDGDRTLTVLRRNSLERNPQYASHDDPDYEYVDKQNKRFSTVPDNIRESKTRSELQVGERIVRQNITDYDKEVYHKHINLGDRSQTYDFHGDPHKHRYTMPSWRDYDSALYYGDIRDVTRFEESVISNYSGIVPEFCSYREHNSTPMKATDDKRYTMSSRKSKTPRLRVSNYRDSMRTQVRNNDLVTNTDFSFRKSVTPVIDDDGVEVSYLDIDEHEEPVHSFRHSSKIKPVNYERFTGISEIPRISDSSEIKKTTPYQSQTSSRPVNNYQMVERDNVRDSDTSDLNINPHVRRESQQRVGNSDSKGKFTDGYSPERNQANRLTGYSTTYKRRNTGTNENNRADSIKFEISSNSSSNY